MTRELMRLTVKIKARLGRHPRIEKAHVKVAMDEKLLLDIRDGPVLCLPADIGATVWEVRENPACHHGVRMAERFLYGEVITPRQIAVPVPFAPAMSEKWGRTIFPTEKQAREAIQSGRQT